MKDYYKEKAVSNSSLSWLKVSPKYFKLKLDKDIDEFEPQFFKEGRQIHAYILEPKEFDKEFEFLEYTVPSSPQQKTFCKTFANSKKGKKDEKLLAAYKEAYSSKESDEKLLEKAKKLEKDNKSYIKFIKLSKVKTVLPISMMHKLNKIRSAIMSHRKARELMFNENNATFGNNDKLFIKNEIDIFWEYPEPYVLPCKSMIDRLIIDHENKEVIMVDLKTTSHLAEFKEKALEYEYNRQMAFYWMALQWYFKHELKLDASDYKKTSYIVAVTKQDPIETKVYKVSENTLLQGFKQIENLIPSLKYHWDNDKWDYPMNYYEGEGIEII